METRSISPEKSLCFLNMGILGGRVRNWKRRWFVITDGCLFYFETRTVIHFSMPMVVLMGLHL